MGTNKLKNGAVLHAMGRTLTHSRIHAWQPLVSSTHSSDPATPDFILSFLCVAILHISSKLCYLSQREPTRLGFKSEVSALSLSL